MERFKIYVYSEPDGANEYIIITDDDDFDSSENCKPNHQVDGVHFANIENGSVLPLNRPLYTNL